MISRKDFLKNFLAIPFLGGWLSKIVATNDPENEYLLNQFSIAGFQYYEGPELIDKFKEGDILNMEAEPENIHDEYAVKILYSGFHIGYVPRSDNKHISRLLRNNVKLKCKISDMYPGEIAWQMLQVKVYLLA